MMESEVIRRAQLGDEDAFDQLVESYSSLVWSTAVALLGNRSQAEDVAQEAWLDVWKALPSFQLDRSFRAWVLVIAANRCRKFHRRRVLSVTSIDQDDEELRDHLASHQDMEAHLIRSETNAEIRAVLARLSTEQQAILELRFFADLELAEIALIMNIPLGTVKSRLHRALQAFRQRLNTAHSLAGPPEDYP